jgi:acyl-ACP thioesterase
MLNMKREKSYSIHYFDLDQNSELRFGVLLDFLQDSAGEDADARGFGIEHLLPRGLTWMLSRYRVRLDSVVKRGDRLKIRTWPSLHKGLSACREFEILANERLIGVASTAWMLIDLEQRRPVRPKEKLGDVFLLEDQVFEEPLSAIHLTADLDPGPGFRVRRTDIDLNCHVNNRVFFDWAAESISDKAIENRRLQQVDINYLAEALAGEEILTSSSCLVSAEGLKFSHLIRRQSDQKDLAKLQTLWVPAGAA